MTGWPSLIWRRVSAPAGCTPGRPRMDRSVSVSSLGASDSAQACRTGHGQPGVRESTNVASCDKASDGHAPSIMLSPHSSGWFSGIYPVSTPNILADDSYPTVPYPFSWPQHSVPFPGVATGWCDCFVLSTEP